ncbi:MAG TPA: DEAD/DEAH box helicase [Thermoanaerobaculia bacterium]|nr:DEAD/DEAH box helicase [Thermoanaerobaculia bacterium]
MKTTLGEETPLDAANPSSRHLTDTLFSSYDLPDEVRWGIADAGFAFATPIQEKVLPLALAGRDVAGQAQTGTGKTAAFLITIFARLLRQPRVKPARGPRALIVAPTRELVVQIRDEALQLGRHTGLEALAVFGGIDYHRQRDAVRRVPDLLVGTPGRLLDYEQQGATTFRDVEILVIDEADRMFDMGFIRDLRRILRRCPPYNKRQTMLFSATLSIRVMELAYEHTNNAQKIEIEPERVLAHGIREILYHVSSAEKFRLLLGLLEREGGRRILIFVNRRSTAADLVRGLSANGYPTRALAGDVPQERRLRILNDFKDGKLAVLVATDVASRGLHIEGVSHVINYDLPQDSEDYVHRIGRTGRAGAEGDAVSFACEDYVFSLDAIEKRIGRKIPTHPAPEELLRLGPVAASPRAPRARRPPPRRPSASPAPPTASAEDSFGRTKRPSRRR